MPFAAQTICKQDPLDDCDLHKIWDGRRRFRLFEGLAEVTAQIGAGGMGEVYRATDSQLGREVAIKVLPEAFAHDAERLARFEREARTRWPR